MQYFSLSKFQQYIGEIVTIIFPMSQKIKDGKNWQFNANISRLLESVTVKDDQIETDCDHGCSVSAWY